MMVYEIYECIKTSQNGISIDIVKGNTNIPNILS